eukprot:scaffold15776_cov75-Phaeocystis_antarctica.AAC.4
MPWPRPPPGPRRHAQSTVTSAEAWRWERLMKRPRIHGEARLGGPVYKARPALQRERRDD